MEQSAPDPQQDRRVLIAVVMSVVVLWFFSNFIFQPPPKPPPVDPTAPIAETTPGVDSTPAAPALADGDDDSASDDDDSAPGTAAAPVEPAPPPEPAVEPTAFSRRWEGIESGWSSFGGGPNRFAVTNYSDPFEQDWIPSWLFKGIRSGFKFKKPDFTCPASDPVDIVKDHDGVLLPVGMDAAGLAADIGDYRLVSQEGNNVEYQTSRDGLEITKVYTLPTDGYRIEYEVRVKNISGTSKQLLPSFGVADFVKSGEAGRYGPQPETWADVDGDVKSKGRRKLEKKGPLTYEGPVSWVGVGDRYFMVGLEPAQEADGNVLMTAMPGEDRYTSSYSTPAVNLAPDEVKSWTFRLWAGPKQLSLLKDSDMRLGSAVDFGFFGLIALPILSFLKFIQGFVGSWGISIILLTITIKLLLFPLSQKAYRSMKAMQTLQPEINALKEKHGDDREAMNKEMMGLWKEHGVNPMGGCLPMIIQMPIWFALYRVLWNSVELYQTPFLYFCDLSLRDPLGVFPLALGLTMWLQQKFTPNTATDPAQQAVIKFMPLFFSVIMFTLPAGLVVYILVNNILSIGQQWFIHRQYGPPPKKVEAGKKTKADSKGSGSKK